MKILKIILIGALLIFSINIIHAQDISDNCKNTVNKSDYPSLTEGLIDKILNIGDKLHKKVLNKNNNEQISYFSKLTSILNGINTTSNTTKGEIIGLLKEDFNCKIYYLKLNAENNDGIKFKSLTLKKSGILKGGTDGFIGFKDNIKNIVFKRGKNGEDYLLGGAYKLDYNVTKLSYNKSYNKNFCTNGMQRVKVYIPPYIKYFQLVVQPFPLNDILMYATYEPIGVLDETKAKIKKEISKDYKGNETNITSKFYDYLYGQHKTVLMKVNDAFSFIVRKAENKRYDALRFIDNTKGGYLYLSFSQGSELGAPYRDYDKNYNIGLSYYVNFQDDITEEMRQDILSKIPNGETEPASIPFTLIENSCD